MHSACVPPDDAQSLHLVSLSCPLCSKTCRISFLGLPSAMVIREGPNCIPMRCHQLLRGVRNNSLFLWRVSLCFPEKVALWTLLSLLSDSRPALPTQQPLGALGLSRGILPPSSYLRSLKLLRDVHCYFLFNKVPQLFDTYLLVHRRTQGSK